MREIKFRAWDKENSRMLHNVGFSFSDVGMQVELERPMMIQDGQHFSYPSSDFELMQCTGLKDKNGVDIYEEDILNCEQSTVEVKWEYDGFEYIDEAGRSILVGKYNPDRKLEFYEVTGNKYENPEMSL